MKYYINYNHGGKQKLWNEELKLRLGNLDEKKLYERNKLLGDKFKAIKPFLDFVQNNKIPLFLTNGLAIGAVRHNGFIDFGGLDYRSGYDDDFDFACVDSDLEYITNKLKETNFKLKLHQTFSEYLRKYNPEVIDRLSKDLYDKIKDKYLIGLINIPNYGDIDFIIWQKNNDSTIDRMYDYQNMGRYWNFEFKETFKYNEIFPLKSYDFYNSKVYIPANFFKTNGYGNNVLNEIIITNHDSARSIKDKYIIENEKAPRVNIIY